VRSAADRPPPPNAANRRIYLASPRQRSMLVKERVHATSPPFQPPRTPATLPVACPACRFPPVGIAENAPAPPPGVSPPQPTRSTAPVCRAWPPFSAQRCDCDHLCRVHPAPLALGLGRFHWRVP
jgi:hypothetical protein